MSAALAEHYSEVVGIDISDEMVRLAEKFRPRANTRILQVTEPPLPFAEREFDCVYSTIVVQHISFPYNLQYLGEFFRVSRDLVLIDAPSHLRDSQPPGPGIFLLDFRYALTCAAQNGFDLIALREFPATATRQYQYLFRRIG
jgi:ubiquinone/menaquinone biosynthesis C-methylase UbiE